MGQKADKDNYHEELCSGMSSKETESKPNDAAQAEEDGLEYIKKSTKKQLFVVLLNKFGLYIGKDKENEIVVEHSDSSIPEALDDEANIESIEFNHDSQSINLTTQPVDNCKIFNEVLTCHPDPRIIRKLVLNGKNRLDSIPITIGFLVNMTVLDLKDNYIQDIPWSVVYLRNLQALDLSYNMITKLPKVVGCLISLQDLNLEANHISYLPSDMLKLHNLKNINLKENKKLIFPRQDVCEKGVEAIFEALHRRKDRTNVWENCTPWIIGESLISVGHPEVRTLWDLCVDTVVCNGVDFRCPVFVPPVVKTHLNEKADEYANRLEVAKCNVCHKYYSSKEKFEHHNCN